MFALVIGLLTTFNQTARAESWSWENLFSFGSSANAAAVCTTNPVVVNDLDSGAGSLRQAVIDACPGSTITFGEAVHGTISLTTGRIVIDKNLTITGPGADALTIRNASKMGDQNNVIYVNAGVTAVLSDLTVSDGYAYHGGGIFNLGNLTVRNAVIRNNLSVDYGSGISSFGGALTIVNSIFTDNGQMLPGQENTALGGGISVRDTSLTITDSTFSGNLATKGGGIYAAAYSSVTITNSTISDNGNPGWVGSYTSGGGLYLAEGVVATLTNCTVSHNRAGKGGGGIYMEHLYGSSTLTLINSTVTKNRMISNSENFGGGISNPESDSTVNVRNSIIAGNIALTDSYFYTASPDFYGTLTSQGYNLIGTTDT